MQPSTAPGETAEWVAERAHGSRLAALLRFVRRGSRGYLEPSSHELLLPPESSGGVCAGGGCVRPQPGARLAWPSCVPWRLGDRSNGLSLEDDSKRQSPGCVISRASRRGDVEVASTEYWAGS